MSSDQDFLQKFENCSLSKEDFSHEAHIRMAWLYIKHLPFDQALSKIRQGINRFNQAQGNITGYHETVTVSFARLIYNAFRSKPLLTWEEFRGEYPSLFDRDQPILHQYYRKETLALPHACREFVAPDLQDL